MTTTLPFASQALRHLRRRDPTLRPVFQRIGPFALRLVSDRFPALVSAILSQQLSVKAADTIEQRLQAQMPRRRFTPAAVLALPETDLRAAGLSRAKVTYVRDLATKVHSGAVPLHDLHDADDETVIEKLTQVKGIGRWTAEMFLIFSLGRPDVLPVDDLGLRAAIQRLDNLPELPTKSQVAARGATWQPFRTVATWYLWQSLRLARQE
jgi:DNA-3-methyladenine glycosylase II